MKHHKYRGPRLAQFPRRIRRLKKAIRTLARGLSGGITSPPRPWFRVSCLDLDDGKPDVRAFIDMLQAAMERQFAERPPWWLESDLPPHMRKWRYCTRIANVDVWDGKTPQPSADFTLPIPCRRSNRNTAPTL